MNGQNAARILAVVVSLPPHPEYCGVSIATIQQLSEVEEGTKIVGVSN